MYCHQVDYELFGRDMQIVEVELDPGETVIAEAGGSRQGEGSILRTLGDILEGD